MDVGAILSKSFNLYKRNLNLVLPQLIVFLIGVLLFIAFALVTALILLFVLGSLTITSIMSLVGGPIPFLFLAYLIFGFMALMLIMAVLGAHARAAVIGMVVEAEKTGKTTLKTGIESAKRHGLKIFGYTIAISFIPILVIGAIITAAVVVLAIISAGSGAGSYMGFASMAFIIFLVFLFLIAYVIIYVLAMFSPQKIVLENLGIIDGIKASFGFVKKYPTEVVIYIGVAFAVGVVTSLVSLAFIIPRIIFELMDSSFIAMFLQIFENLFSVAVGLIVAPYLEAVKTLLVLEGDNKNEVESPPVL